jgi:hypothetical protein
MQHRVAQPYRVRPGAVSRRRTVPSLILPGRAATGSVPLAGALSRLGGFLFAVIGYPLSVWEGNSLNKRR